MAYYGHDGGESEPALVSAPIENEIAADDHAGEGCDALPLMASRITQTEVPSCVSDQQDANECGAPEVLHDDQHSADAHRDKMGQPDHLKATDPDPVGTDTEGVQPLHSFPGENEIGSMLADICAKIAYHSKWELREWAAGAKLLVIMRDVHGYTGERYEQYALARMPIRNPRDAHSLYLLGYRPSDDGIANGDLVVQRCEAESRLNSNYVWPNWRKVVADLRREAQRSEQGDGAGSSTADEADDSEPDEPAPGEPEPDEPAPDTAVDPVAKLDAEIGRLKSKLAAARQSFRSERAQREEVQDALLRLRVDITRLLSISEKPLWDAMIPPQPPPEKRTESEPETVSETALGPEPLTPDPESPRTVEEAVSLVYRGRRTETCETVAEALHSVQMQDWDRDDFDRLREGLDGVADWHGDHSDTAWAVSAFESAPILFGTANGVLLYEDGLQVLTWPQAMERIAPQVEAAESRRELERRQQAYRKIMARKLPAKRKLKAMRPLLNEHMALQPTTIKPEAARAIDFIRRMQRDDERFAVCQTFADYLRKATEITAQDARAATENPGI